MATALSVASANKVMPRSKSKPEIFQNGVE